MRGGCRGPQHHLTHQAPWPGSPSHYSTAAPAGAPYAPPPPIAAMGTVGRKPYFEVVAFIIGS